MREIIDDRADFRRAQRSAPNLCTHRIEAAGGGGRRDGHQTADRLGEATECRLGEAKIIWADETVVISDEQGRQQHFGVAAQLDAAETAKHFRTQCAGPARDHGHIFAPCIQIDAADLELRARCGDDRHFARPVHDFS